MKSKFLCPSCEHPLQWKFAPEKSDKNPSPYAIVWCGNSRCPSDAAANNGGSGPTEEAAYRALLLSVKHEEDKEIAEETPELSAEDCRNLAEDWKAEHANDIERSGGV